MLTRNARSLIQSVLIVSLCAKFCASQDKECKSPSVPLHCKLVLNAERLVPGTEAKFKCDEGYILFGNRTLTCAESGKWIGEAPFCGVNVALRKPSNQSSSVRGGSASNGNDGDKTTVHDGKRCTETQKEPSPWWSVNLLRPYRVKAIKVTTRGCCGQPVLDLEIRIGNSSHELQRNPLCAWYPGTLDEGITKTFTCARALVGQFVFLQLVGVESSLSVCEVEVFSDDEFSSEHCFPDKAAEAIQVQAFSHICYEFKVQGGGSFKQASDYCQANKGQLAHNFNTSITTFLNSELEYRKNYLKTQLVWIGATKDPGLISKTWRWVNGEVVSRPTWGKDQPNNYNGEQNCVVLDGGRNWLWNDVGCNLDYLHWICQYAPINCGHPDIQENSIMTHSSLSTNAKIYYSCPTGHVLRGNNTRQCQNTGFWSGTAPSCQFIDCGTLPDIKDGTITLPDKRTTYNATVTYACKQNYTRLGEETRVCQENGKWSGSEAKCLFNWCPEPPTVTGAVVNVTGKHVGSTVTYSCTHGYILVGQATLLCEYGGKWSSKPPSCKYIDCNLPLYIENGQYHLINGTTSYGSMAEYTCADDFWLRGQARLMCTNTGKWSSDAPFCELITCEEPELPPGSYIVGYDFNVHSSIEYHCEPGHILQGDSLHRCLSNGQWSGQSPSCTYIDCGHIPPVLYGTIEYLNGTTYLGSQLAYNCSRNYKLVGPRMRTCLEDGKWSDQASKCEEIRCPEPVFAEHSILSVTGNDRMYGRTLLRTSDSANSIGSGTTYKIGALVKYRCERGYKIVGDSLSTCDDYGRWTGDLPQCVYVDCDNPQRIQHGKFTLASNVTYYGATALYECDPNYELDGVSRRLCIENGTWSSSEPKCREIHCTDPETINLATFVVNTRSIGGIATYSCPKGYTLRGNSSRVCVKQGTWTGKPPSCDAVTCPDPGSVDNGRVIIMNGTSYNSVIEYHCVPKFERVGPYLRKCMENGLWSGEQPRCQVAISESQESDLGTTFTIGCSVVILLLIILGLIYMKLRKSTPVKNTENIEGAERKEDQNAAVMSYASLNDSSAYLHSNIYDDIHDNNVYDSPYSVANSMRDGYEPEPEAPPSNMVTINGVAIR